jgi:hypothetical protein
MAKQGAGRSRKPLCITTVHRAIQIGIAEGLKKWYEPPQELSQELARLLACAKEQHLTSVSDSPSAQAGQRLAEPLMPLLHTKPI